MTAIILQLLSGLTHAMILFLIASGLALIFGVARTINFAHGSFFMLGAYLSATAAGGLPVGDARVYAGMVCAALLVAVLGGIVEMGLLRRVYRAPELYQLLLTFALVLILNDAVRFFWGAENRLGPRPSGLGGAVSILGAPFPVYDLVILVVGPGVAAGLWLLLHATRWGILVRAAAQDRQMVAALGVNQGRLLTGVFVLGSGLAGLAGALQMPRQPLDLGMDAAILIEAFVVTVIGGMGSIGGAFLGSVLIGVLQSLGVLWLPRELHLVLVFLLMAVVLVVRPEGLLGVAAPAADSGPTQRREPPVPRWLRLAGIALLLLLPLTGSGTLLLLATEVVAFVLFAASLQLLVGAGGMLSFGHAAFFGMGAYGAALVLKGAGAPMLVAIPVGALLAAVLAGLIGLLCVRAHGIILAMLSLACAQVAYAVAHQWYGVTGGDNGILGVWPAAPFASPVRYYALAALIGLGGLGLLSRVSGSSFGLTLRAARDHPVRCAAVGVNVRAVQLLAFVVAGAFAGAGGAVFAFLKGSVFPEYFSIAYSVEGLIMLLLGGLHSLAGASLGAALFKVLDVEVARVSEYWQALLGAILLALVLLFPDGVMGAFRPRRKRGGIDG
jgi:branched-chain amino acid transport system permease protein